MTGQHISLNAEKPEVNSDGRPHKKRDPNDVHAFQGRIEITRSSHCIAEPRVFEISGEVGQPDRRGHLPGAGSGRRGKDVSCCQTP